MKNDTNIESKYYICSDIYGHSIRLPIETIDLDIDCEFLKDVENGYDHGVLHDCGHLVFNFETKKLAFLVSVILSEGIILNEDELNEISEKYGVNLEFFKMEDSINKTNSTLIVAELNNSSQFKLAYDITVDIVAAEQRLLSKNKTKSEIKL